MEQKDGMPIRVAIFIDGSNFYKSIKTLFNDRLTSHGIKRLVDSLLKGRLLIEAFYYNAPLDNAYDHESYRKQQSFFAQINGLPGFRVILCRMQKLASGGYRVKGDDIQIATDMIVLAFQNAYDVAILVSGDGDFVPAIKAVQKLGKKVENAYFSVSASSFLKQICDTSVRLDDIAKTALKEN